MPPSAVQFNRTADCLPQLVVAVHLSDVIGPHGQFDLIAGDHGQFASKTGIE